MNQLKHIAFIMDGNGRWAKLRNKPRVFGHAQGVKNIFEIVKYCIENRIQEVSFFAFSLENWNRSQEEVTFLMKLLLQYLNKQTIIQMQKFGIVGKWIGFEDKLSKTLIKKIKNVEKQTQSLRKKIQVNLFFNYSGKHDILEAIKQAQLEKNLNLSPESYLLTSNLLPIDLLIRTSGEQRISNFCLYNLAYSEIIFEQTYWPDYNLDILKKNITEFYERERRFGKI